MIVITLAGDSSRFFTAGYTIVKYKLPFSDATVIESILNYIPRTEKLLIVLNRKFNDVNFMVEILTSMNFINFRVVALEAKRGQFETVIKGLQAIPDFWNENEYITIFNGDTIRRSTNWNFKDCDGYIEVFEDEGTHWSFVDSIGIVSRVTEKDRISAYCSSGLYFFKSIHLILENMGTYLASMNKEIYIAPFYNFLIQRGYLVMSGLVEKETFIFCGTPAEYQFSLNNNLNAKK